MRVISGEYRSRKLKTLEGLDTRPTLDKVKGAIFNHLGNLCDKSFLDVFCGCGNIGIEAVSRNSEQVVFNDNNPEAIEVLRENLNTLKVESDRYRIFCLSYQELFKRIDGQFDFIYLDPPFACDLFLPCLQLIKEKEILRSEGEIIIESEVAEVLNNPWFVIRKEAIYGRIKISYCSL